MSLQTKISVVFLSDWWFLVCPSRRIKLPKAAEAANEILVLFFSPFLSFPVYFLCSTVVELGPFQSEPISMLHAKTHRVTWATAVASWKNISHRVTCRENTFPLQALKNVSWSFVAAATDIVNPHRASQVSCGCFSQKRIRCLLSAAKTEVDVKRLGLTLDMCC